MITIHHYYFKVTFTQKYTDQFNPPESLYELHVEKASIHDPLAACLIAQLVKNLPIMQETMVRFLGQEDPLEKVMATHSSILTWKIPWTEELGRLQSVGLRELGMT